MPSESPIISAATSWSPAERSLGGLVARLQSAVLDVVCAPRGLDVNVGEPVILDPTAALPAADSIVLAVGVEGERDRLSLIRRLGTANVGALILKDGEVPSAALTDAATDAGVALLTVPSALSWGQLYTLLLTAGAATVPPAEHAGVPLGDLFALANAVAAMVGGATTIEDPQNRVLAYSNLDHPIDFPRQQTILGRQVPADWISRLQEAGIFRRLWQSTEVVRITDMVGDDAKSLPRLAVTVRAGGELLGSIWVIEGERPLQADAERTLREVADMAALHLLRHRSASDVDRRRRAEALLGVLEGRDLGEQALAALALDRGRPMAVIAFALRDHGESDAVVSAQRVVDLIAVYSDSYTRHAACTSVGGRVYALVPVDPKRPREAVASLAGSVVDRSAQALHVQLSAGIGGTVDSLDDVVGSRREADRVVDVLLSTGRPDVATLEQVRAQVLLSHLRALAAEHPELTAGPLAMLAEQDAAKGTPWIPTLRAYFDAFGDIAAAAAQVNVHPNTFRYRLRRIVELFGVDIDDPDERLITELQLRFL